MQKLKSASVTKSLIGRWIRCHWDDVGARDGIVLDVQGKVATVVFPNLCQTEEFEEDRIIAVGPALEFPVF